MTMTDRDRKLLTFLVPVVLIAAYWFLFLAPQRDEASKLGDELAVQQQKRDDLQARVAQLGQARDDFAADYAAVVELGKAVPTSVDMPSLIVQLDKASHGTGIDFERIHVGERLPAASAAPTAGSGAAPAAAAGGEKASTGPGKATEKANETKAQQDKAASGSSGGSSGGTSGSSAQAGAPAGGETSGVPGLDAVPLEFTFDGTFFDLADFFHRMKRFVHVVNNSVDVRGRLLTIEGINFKTTAFPSLEAQVTAKVYLAPKDQGSTAGASPAGPAPGTQASSPAPAPSSAPPAATVAR